MENMQSAAGMQDNSIMKSVNQRARPKGRSDIVTRRLKNRERQRRYRARKRLEADTRKPIPVIELQVNENHSNFMTRIYCKRDWKKDARQAHVPKHQEMNGSIDPSSTLTSVSELTCLTVENKSEPMLEREIQSGSSSVNNEPPRIVLGRRDWKAEARRKKN